MSDLLTGTLTFLLTDLEGSTELWERHPETMASAMAKHDQIIEGVVKSNSGLVVRPRGEGDSRFAVFQQAGNAVRAAMDIQQAFAPGGERIPLELKTRIGIHTGTADLRSGDYYGSTVNRCARLRSLGYGGQVLLSQVSAELVRDDLPEGVSLVDLGTHHLRGLSRPETVYQLWLPGLSNTFPPLESPEGVDTNLPAPPTPFIGRERELAEVSGMLSRKEVRLVTLTGPGGIGKTRLCLEIGRALLDHFQDGVFFIDLAPISDPALAATTVAHSLGIREGGGRPPIENLKDYLSGKNLLLILDNFEQITGAAQVVADLLAYSPGLKVLVTSRVALHIRGEFELPISQMSLPPGHDDQSIEQIKESEAVKLFVQRAGAVQPGFQLKPENSVAVVAICRRLDGLPLAIEIAAARIKVLPPEALLNRLDKSLKLLVGGAADSPIRHQTLRNAIDWSYNLLKPDEQLLFSQLSVFVGGFSLESAEKVCNSEGDLDVFSGIEALINASLLQAVESASGEPRFTMLLTIREYALEKLEATGRLADLRRTHAIHFAAKATELGSQINGRQSVAGLARMDEEHDNFRATLSWGLEAANDIDLAVNLCLTLIWFWYRHGHFHEGRDWCERAMAATQKPGADLLHAMALFGGCSMAIWEGDLRTAAAWAEQSLQIYKGLKDESFLPTLLLATFGVIQLNQGRDKDAYACLAQAAEQFDQLGDRFYLATNLVHLANAALGLGEFNNAIAWLDQAMPIIAQYGDPWQIAFCLNNYGEVARAQGDYKKARGYYLRTEASYREADALGDHARLVHTFGYLALHDGELEKALALFNDSLVKFRELGNRRGIAECLAGLAAISAEGQACEHATLLLGAATALLARLGGAWWPADRVEIEHTLVKIKSTLSEDEFTSSWNQGQAMNMDQALAYTARINDVSTQP